MYINIFLVFFADRKRQLAQIPIDPYRHFESMIIEYYYAFRWFFIIIQGQAKFWHNRRCTSSSLVDNLTDISHTEPVMPRRSR